MNRYFVSYKSIICCMFLVALGIANCAVSSTPQRLQLIDGAIDPCLLITPTELETVTALKAVGRNFPISFGTNCTYSTSDAKTALSILVVTDATLKRGGDNGTTKDLYNGWKALNLERPEDYYTVEDVDGLGSQAYFNNRQNFELTVDVLNNGIFYEFAVYTTSGANRDQLIQIARIALQRAP